RGRLAEASALERSLGQALTHEPGEAYFADFAERVGRRIATAEPVGRGIATAEPIGEASKKKSLLRWLLSPRGLTLVGSTAALLATAGVAWLRFYGENDAARALREAAPSPVGVRAGRTATPPAPEPGARFAPQTTQAPIVPRPQSAAHDVVR